LVQETRVTVKDPKSATKRLLRALAGETVTPPPFWFMRQAGRYLPEYRAVREQAGDFLSLCYTPEYAVEVTLQPLRRYAMDAAILFADILLIPDALGQSVAYREGEGPVLEPVASEADLGRLDSGRLHDHLAPVYETVSILAEKLPADATLIGFAGAPWTVATYMVEGRGSRDYAAVKGWAYAAPESFQKLIDLLIEATAAYLIEQIRAGAEAVQIFDTWAGVLAEPAFQRWCMAPVKRIVKLVREAEPGVPIIAFPRGAGPLYTDYVAATEVDGVSIDSVLPTGWAARELQGRCTVQGNLDPLALVSGGDAMREETARILDVLGHGPFIFNLGHGIVPQTPPEHVAELADLIRGWTG
jgi:uroporphyrinogen decarboxylase